MKNTHRREWPSLLSYYFHFLTKIVKELVIADVLQN